MISEKLPKGVGHVFDLLSVTALLGTILNAMPAIGAVMTVVWTGLRIYESCLTIADRRRRRERLTDID